MRPKDARKAKPYQRRLIAARLLFGSLDKEADCKPVFAFQVVSLTKGGVSSARLDFRYAQNYTEEDCLRSYIRFRILAYLKDVVTSARLDFR